MAQDGASRVTYRLVSLRYSYTKFIERNALPPKSLKGLYYFVIGSD